MQLPQQDSQLSTFRLLMFSSFISQAGSHLLTLALSAFVYHQTKSLTSSAGIFVATFVPAILLSAKLGSWIDANANRKSMVYIEVLAIVTSVICGTLLMMGHPILTLLPILCIRSILLYAQRNMIVKWIKIISKPEIQAERFKIHSFTFFLSTAIAGLAASALLISEKILPVIIADVATYILSIILIAFLPKAPVNNVYELQQPQSLKAKYAPESLAVSLRYIFLSPILARLCVIVWVSQALFQGAYSTLISYLPLKHLSLGLSEVGNFQLAASSGIIAAFLLLRKKPKLYSLKYNKISFGVLGTIIAGCIALSACSLPTLQETLFAFFAFNFCYELVWLFSSSEFLRACPQHSVARLGLVLHSTAGLLMSLSALGYGFFIPRIGLLNTIYLLILLHSTLFLIPMFTRKFYRSEVVESLR